MREKIFNQADKLQCGRYNKGVEIENEIRSEDMRSREEKIQRLEQAKEDKVYYCYGIEDFTILSDEKINDLYINMQNYLSDRRTTNTD